MRGHSLEGSLGPSRRPDLDIGGDAREPWFDRFRAQVSARSAAAARCFPDVARGAFRWDVDLRSNEGEASHSAYAPVAGLPELNDAQVACLEAALASAPFSLGAFKRESVRVSIVIEF